MTKSQVLSSHKEGFFNPKANEKVFFGFWVYLMTDCVLFASLFATFAVLHANTFGGPSGEELFSLPFVLTETLFLLTSSFTCGLAVLFAKAQNKKFTLLFFALTFLLGTGFLGLELSEFSKMVASGNSFQRSGFLSAFFTLVGTHGLHISVGLLWMLIMMIKTYRFGLTEKTIGRLTMLSLFWHFLDIIWIFIFSVVYLLGVL